MTPNTVADPLETTRVTVPRPKQSAKAYGYSPDSEGTETINNSAQAIVPLLVEQFKPQSVLDLGCGVGDWLSVFQKCGVEEITGFDGKWTAEQNLRIDRSRFQAVDFYGQLPPFPRVDLAMCLEVVEHVDEAIGEKMVALLCQSSDLVFFSAAIPGQPGYKHINCHYQDYWVQLFEAHGFKAYDLIRPRVWNDEKVSVWYKQNCLVFANAAAAAKYDLHYQPFMTSFAHPWVLDSVLDPKGYGLTLGISKLLAILACMPHYFYVGIEKRLPWKKSSN